MLVLASRSPTRSRLLENAGIRFETETADIDERQLESAARRDGAGIHETALALSAAKALAVSAIRPGDLVIGADQMLDLEGETLHKPADRAAALRQLARLTARTHRLHAAVSLVRAGHVIWSHAASAELTMRACDEAELERIVDLEGDAILASVGAYRLEGPSVQLFSRIEGDYFTILGLPLLALIGALREHAPQALTGGIS
ncbi:MAG TPA: Maf family protein [Devosiaceae bacterium]